MLTFSQLVLEVATLAQRSGDSEYANKIKTWINISQKDLFDIYDWFPQLEGEYNFSTVDGTENYYMPNDFDKPLRVYDLTNKKKIDPTVRQNYFDANIANIADEEETSAPAFYSLYGTKGVSSDIADAGTIVKVKSSSSSDTSNVTVRVEGYIDSAKTILDFEDISVSSGTPTNFVDGTKPFYDITHVSKDQDTVGYITLANATEDVLAILTSVDRVLSHRVMKLGLIPNQVNSMRVLYKKKMRRLVNDNDYPFIDADDFIILNSYGYSLSEEKEGAEKASQIWSKASTALTNVLNNVIGSQGSDYQEKMITPFMQSHRTR
jgi:hypothetical protein